jgi:hypothetical protein
VIKIIPYIIKKIKTFYDKISSIPDLDVNNEVNTMINNHKRGKTIVYIATIGGILTGCYCFYKTGHLDIISRFMIGLGIFGAIELLLTISIIRPYYILLIISVIIFTNLYENYQNKLVCDSQTEK